MDTLEKIHVAIIMDGNGRWAKKRGLPRVFGHKEGVHAAKNIVTYARKNNLKALSMFAFSAENWLRPKEEVSFLIDLLNDYVLSEWSSIIDNNIKFIVSGNIERIPEKTRNNLLSLIDASKNNTGMILNMVLSYSAQDEMIDAFKSMYKDIEQGKIDINNITYKDIQNKLYNPELSDIDLLIRTSGEKRISNFMLFRLSYSELYFTDTLWPDFKEQDFDKAIEDFNSRIRRFGKTDEQIINERG